MKTDHALERGLYRSVVDSNGAIRDEAWRRAASIGDVIGLCRRCDGLMKAVALPDNGRTSYYCAECLSCYAEISLPTRHGVGGAVLRRSARLDEMPDGAWEYRINYLTRMRQQAKGGAA